MTVSEFSCFWWPWEFWSILVRYFVECPLVGIYLMFISWLQWGCMFFLWMTTEVKCHSHNVTSRVHISTWLVTVYVNLDHMAWGGAWQVTALFLFFLLIPSLITISQLPPPPSHWQPLFYSVSTSLIFFLFFCFNANLVATYKIQILLILLSIFLYL